MSKTTYYPTSKRLEKLSKEDQLSLYLDLINVFKTPKTHNDTVHLLVDLLTANEIKNLSKRLRIAKLLLVGKSQRDIASSLHCSHATTFKVNTWLSQGGEGLRKAISKLPKRYKMPTNLPPTPLEFHTPQTLLTMIDYGLYKKQSKQIEDFANKIGAKEVLDSSLQEAFDEDFRNSKSKKTKK